jgi:DNA topoisomerase-3
MEHDFGDAHRKWHSCSPIDLFDAPVEAKIRSDNRSIEQNLLSEARNANMLMIWTDCDREGENIGAEVAAVCRRANRGIEVKRARFSAIIREQIHRAAQNPVPLDMAQADAVEARTILDLKIGAAFTRMQTMALQARFPQLKPEEGQKSSVVSYGNFWPYCCITVYSYSVASRSLPVPNSRLRRLSIRPSQGIRSRDILVHPPIS